mmetsp:Transcript_124377/g.194859  ORF Transcript_124377/g.194859 Transcript_124377/m.194859 type:complete len:301 (-) Transcript_124377:48-950(-)
MGCGCSSRPTWAWLGYEFLDGIDQLFPNPSAPPQSVKASLQDNEEAIRILTRAFAGCDEDGGREAEPIFDWLLGPHLKDKWSDPRRHAMTEWMLKFGFALGYAQGMFLFGVKSGSKLTGVVHVDIHKNGWDGHCRRNCIIMNSLRVLGTPPEMNKKVRRKKPTSMTQVVNADTAAEDQADEVNVSKGIQSRMAAMEPLEKYRRQACPGPHMHLFFIAVEWSARRQGLGGKLLGQVNKIADNMRLPLYLETSGEKSKSLYAKYGYEVIARYEFNMNSKFSDVVSPLQVVTMMRLPKQFSTS